MNLKFLAVFFSLLHPIFRDTFWIRNTNCKLDKVTPINFLKRVVSFKLL